MRLLKIVDGKLHIEMTDKELDVIVETLSATIYYYDTVKLYLNDIDIEDIENVSDDADIVYDNLITYLKNENNLRSE